MFMLVKEECVANLIIINHRVVHLTEVVASLYQIRINTTVLAVVQQILDYKMGIGIILIP